MDKKRKILNNQQLTTIAVDHEIRITKLETKKKKIIKKCGKGPKVTIADVMQTLVKFQNSVDERFNKLENRIDKLETSVDKQFSDMNNRVSKIEQQFSDMNNRVSKIEQQFSNMNNRVSKIEKEVFKKQIKN